MSRRDFIGIARQTELKTMNAVPAFFPPVIKESISIDRTILNITETLGSRAPGGIEYGGRVYKGDIELAFRPVSSPLLLSSFCGSPTTTVLLAGVAWSHAYNPLVPGRKPTPLTVMTVNADVTPAIVDAYIGAISDEIELSVEVNDYLLMKTSMVAIDLNQVQAAPSATRDGSQRFPFQLVTAQLSVGGGALTTIPLTGFTFRGQNGLATDGFILGVDTLDDLPESNLTLEVEFTPTTDIPEHYRRALRATPEDCRLVLTATGDVIGASAHRNTVAINIPRLQYTEATVEVDGSETLRNIPIKATAALDDATSQLFSITVINGNNGTNY